MSPFTLHDCQLDKTRIDIWQFPLHTEFAGAQALLNDDEFNRAKRYYFDRHRRRFTVARATLRCILARYLHKNPKDIAFNYNEQGKPSIADPSGIEFNLSHSGELALLAIGQEFALGVDLEWFSARPYQGIAKISFSPAEQDHLRKLPHHLKPLAFFHVWAQKEAFIKACGLGLSYPTQKFDVPVLPTTAQMIHDPLYQQKWQMRSFMPEPSCSAALCYRPEVTVFRYHKLPVCQAVYTHD